MKRDTITVGDLRMDYCMFGSGDKPLVLLPGMSLAKTTGNVEAVAQAYSIFLDDFTVYLLDRKDDFGDSYSVEEMAEDTAAALQALGLSSACVLGISQGGMIAQVLAAKHPELVGKMVLASTMAAANDTARACFLRWKEYSVEENYEPLVEDMMGRFFTDEFIAKNDLIAANLKNPPMPEGFARFIVMGDACMQFDSRDLLGDIRCPVLVIGAGDDSVVSTQASYDLAERLGCEVRIFEGYRHAVFDELPAHKELSYKFFTA